MVLVGAHQGRRQAGDGHRLAGGPRVAVGPEGGVSQVGDDPDRRQRLAAGGDLQGPLEHVPDVGRRRGDGPLQPQALEQEPLGLVRVAEDHHTHRGLARFEGPPILRG